MPKKDLTRPTAPDRSSGCIQQRLANPLATALLEQTIEEGDIVEIDWNGSDFVFRPVGAAAPVR